MIASVEVAEARALARQLLSIDSPQRWDHVKGVARRAHLFVDVVPRWDVLGCAAYLHDIGYAAEVVDTGFHQLDGARYLRRQGWDEAVVNLVAHHSGAQVRADLVGLGATYIAEFPRDETLPHRELHFCDITVALDGSPTTVGERLADMRERHKANPAMMRFLDEHESWLASMVAETSALLGLDANRDGQTLSTA